VRIILVLVVVSAAASQPLWADYWYEHYARAQTALKNDNWEKAVEELQQALERKGDSGARVRTYGMKVEAYFPYLKLGIAYYHLGQIDAALQAFQTEEQLGAIQASPSDFGELENYRNLALEARQQAVEVENERIKRIVGESLRAAEVLEWQGELSDAMAALSEGLAVDPNNAEALTRMEELRAAAAQRERDRLDQVRAAELVDRGRARLEERNYAEASSLLRQAIEIRPSAEANQLFERARDALLAEMQAEQDSDARAAAVASGLNDARQLEGAGRFPEALDRLQPVLAADPENREALALQQKIFQSQQASADQESLARALTQAESEFAAGRFEGAISAANLALAIDPANAEGLETVRQSYGQISRRLLGSRTVENLPPAIRFADLRTDQADGSRAQLVVRPAFRLSGVVIDTSPVDVRFRGPGDIEIDGSSTSQPMGEIYITEFALDDQLDGGASTYQLTATDMDGLSTSAEYKVIYTVPFYRTAWFAVAASLVPIVILAGIWLHRSRRRRQLVKRRFNPYIAGAPVLDTEMFFGRERLIERILQTIHNNSLLLYGERRIGKTSLQHQLKRRLEQLDDPIYTFHPVYVDLQGTPEDQFFATLAEDVFHELEPLLGGLRRAEGLEPGTPYGYRELVADLRRVLKILGESSAKQVKLVLLIDEVDELNAYDPRVNQRLRSLFMKNFAENLVAVVSGVEIRRQWDQQGSPWYNFFEELEVAAIDRDAAIELIRRPIGDVLKFDDSVIDRIIHLTDCRPYLLQRLGVKLVNHMYEQGRRTVTLDDLEAVVADRP
jgi:tetratricopeptide (TPR) repeat protein